MQSYIKKVLLIFAPCYRATLTSVGMAAYHEENFHLGICSRGRRRVRRRILNLGHLV